jgi:hypothetical protein
LAVVGCGDFGCQLRVASCELSYQLSRAELLVLSGVEAVAEPVEAVAEPVEAVAEPVEASVAVCHEYRGYKQKQQLNFRQHVCKFGFPSTYEFPVQK